jgi:hypothetical protein
MLDVVLTLMDEAEVAADAAAIAEAVRVVDRLTAKIAEAVGEFDAAGLWDLDAATSMTAWLRQYTGMTSRAAAAMVQTARRLRSLPVTAEAWRSGRLTGGQVQAIAANVPNGLVRVFAEQEAELVPLLARLSVADTAVAMRHWRATALAALDGEGAPPECSGSALYLSRTLDGRRELQGSFDGELGGLVDAALRLAATDDAEGEARTPAQRRADALGDVCRFFLDHQDDRSGRRHRPHVSVVMTVADLEGGRPARLPDGTPLSAAASRSTVCDSAVHRVVTDGRSAVLDYGTATRTAPAGLFAALVVRDQHCRHPGCDRPPEWCDAHHVVPWQQGGATSLDNMVLKCRRHHTLAHNQGWSEELDPDGTLHIRAPDGRSWSTSPPGLAGMLPTAA